MKGAPLSPKLMGTPEARTLPQDVLSPCLEAEQALFARMPALTMSCTENSVLRDLQILKVFPGQLFTMPLVKAVEDFGVVLLQHLNCMKMGKRKILQGSAVLA